MSGFPFLFWAYTVVWIGLTAYITFLLVRLQAVGRRLDRLERQMEKGVTPSDPAPARSAPPAR